MRVPERISGACKHCTERAGRNISNANTNDTKDTLYFLTFAELLTSQPPAARNPKVCAKDTSEALSGRGALSSQAPLPPQQQLLRSQAAERVSVACKFLACKASDPAVRDCNVASRLRYLLDLGELCVRRNRFCTDCDATACVALSANQSGDIYFIYLHQIYAVLRCARLSILRCSAAWNRTAPVAGAGEEFY